MLCKYQSGFRSISSTVTALREATYVRAYNKNIGKIIAVISLDLKNAFDIVDHNILLSKLTLMVHLGIIKMVAVVFREPHTTMLS